MVKQGPVSELWISEVHSAVSTGVSHDNPAEKFQSLFERYEKRWSDPDSSFLTIWGSGVALYLLSATTGKETELAINALEAIKTHEEFGSVAAQIGPTIEIYRGHLIGLQHGPLLGLEYLDDLKSRLPPMFFGQWEQIRGLLYQMLTAE